MTQPARLTDRSVIDPECLATRLPLFWGLGTWEAVRLHHNSQGAPFRCLFFSFFCCYSYSGTCHKTAMCKQEIYICIYGGGR